MHLLIVESTCIYIDGVIWSDLCEHDRVQSYVIDRLSSTVQMALCHGNRSLETWRTLKN